MGRISRVQRKHGHSCRKRRYPVTGHINSVSQKGAIIMKKVLAMAAAAALTCGVSAFAANPFSDVSPNDWAYQAVESLSQQGVVEGYPDGTFKGQQNITRYEMAQIIARMMANEDQYNAEQRATIDKLASEYADELNSLGVRVSNLEKKVGNVRFDGDARMRYTETYKTGDATGPSTAAGSFIKSTKDKWDGRIRLGATACGE
jgi:Spy/CpxP family protein refolding chaperone